MTGSFDIVFAVPMECQSCVESITKALQPLQGLNSFDINLKDKIVTTNGSLPPSQIVRAIQSTGKDAIIRGTGQPNSAAVCILESFDPKDSHQPVKGLARIVSVGDNDLFIDLSVNGLPKGTYYPSIRESGNLSKGALSTGGLFYQLAPVEVTTKSSPSTVIPSLGASDEASNANNSYAGQSFLHANLNINELIGRSVILSRLKEETASDSLCGVIARSAGIWENNKEVCSCSGKSVWQERADVLSKGLAV